MMLNISIDEAIELIQSKIQKPIRLQIVNSNTINVGSYVKLPLFGTKFINVDFIIDKIVDTDLYLRYTTGKRCSTSQLMRCSHLSVIQKFLTNLKMGV